MIIELEVLMLFRQPLIKKIGKILLSVILALALLTGIYLAFYYHAAPGTKQHVTETIQDAGHELPYRVIRGNQRLIYIPEEPVAGFIFYPGAKVEYIAYTPLMEELASRGIFCVLLHMPGNMAVFGIHAAGTIPEQYPEVPKWYLGGHSLGGAMASHHIAKRADVYDGLILLGSYANADLTNTDLSVLSLYGSEDMVLSRDKYEEAKAFLPADFTETVIEGGCHAYFGNYGPQKGDGEPTISREEQLKQTVEQMVAWMTR